MGAFGHMSRHMVAAAPATSPIRSALFILEMMGIAEMMRMQSRMTRILIRRLIELEVNIKVRMRKK
jgi:flagellar biosynthesis regulator FlbT